MIGPEIASADLSDNAALTEALLKYTFTALLNQRQEDLAFFDQRIEKGLAAKLEGIVGSEFVLMDYDEAIQVLKRTNKKLEFPVKWGVDLQSEHERYLTEKYAKKRVIVMNYPKDIKAFYMRVNDDGRTVAAMDVLAPGIGEIIGGSEREEGLEVLDARAWSSAASNSWLPAIASRARKTKTLRFASTTGACPSLIDERDRVSGSSRPRHRAPAERAPGSRRRSDARRPGFAAPVPGNPLDRARHR
jgi:asparaginyl-tRNA synthetase